MKEGIHPEYKDAKVICACGAGYETRSTAGNFSVEVCANCHPFYTGKQKLLDTKGRVDKFNRKYGTKTPAAAPEAAAKLARASFRTEGQRGSPTLPFRVCTASPRAENPRANPDEPSVPR